MGNIVEFPVDRLRATSRPQAGSEGRVLIFPGVRRERTAPAVPPDRGAPHPGERYAKGDG